MSTLHTARTKQPAILAESLFRLERRGRYIEALAEVEHIWKDIRTMPDVDGFEPGEAAEILLRCGSLIGFHGQNEQIQDSHLICKNLLTEARERFSDIGNAEKVAECESHLAVAYWRSGEFNEADACLAASLEHDIPALSEARLHSHVVASLINFACKRHAENLKYAKLYERDFRKHASEYLNGILCSNIGLSHKNLGNMSAALTYLELAADHYQRARHKIYMATAENNLAQFYKETRKYSKAHESIDNATRIFTQLKDKTREGFSFDTKAMIYFAEAKYADALRSIQKGVSILKKSENTAYLIETLLTKSKILLFLDNFSEAVLALSEAVGMARVQSGDEAAIRLIKEFETALDEKNSPAKKNLEVGDLELILPKSIAHFSEYRGIWINNTLLEYIGLVKGSLAIVASAAVNRGDLVAITELESDEVSCGFYDADFGIVCLEGTIGEPQIFNEKDIKVLGKIVGVCNSGRTEDGKMVVEALNL